VATTMSQTLPPKEHGQFKKILRCYEQKQYKQGLKAAKFILSQDRFKDHGETLALKGLVLNCLDKKKEAYELVKKGLMNHMTSHVCWHVYGLLYRSDKEYTQAIKCYRSALRYDKENTQIMRDLSLLQVQMRDLHGYKETRHQLLTSRPQQQTSWIGYAIALHLVGQYADAAQVISRYEQTQRSTGEEDLKKRDYEAGELVLYKARIMVDDAKYEEALSYLATHTEQIADERALRKMEAEILMAMSELKKAEELTRRMITENREHEALYAQLEQCTGLDDSSPEEERLKMYTDILAEHPRAHAPKRLPLFFTNGALFERLLDEYLQPIIRKGMVPAFRNIRKVYSDPAKVAIVEKVALSYIENLGGASKTFDGKAGSPVQPPTCMIWALYFAAQHFDTIGNQPKAMELINAAITHTPTVLELYMGKAKILKHAGDLKEASRWLNTARELDTADRYINSKAVKYMLRANEVDKATETIGLFTRETADPLEHLSEMQCFWFETERAKAFVRMGHVGKALKVLKVIESHFEQMVEDQFDFHTYCMRKMTLRAYKALLEMEDGIRGHDFYISAAEVTVSCYVGLHDKPFGSKAREEEDAANAGMTPAERKKMLSKQKKAAKKAAAAKAAVAAAAATGKGKGKGKAAAADDADDAKKTDAGDDPMGEKEMKVEKPLEEALKYLTPLTLLAPKRIETHLLAFEVYIRKGKLLLTLRSLKRAQVIDAGHADVHRAKVRCIVKVKEMEAGLSPQVKQVIDAELPGVLGGEMDGRALNTKYLADNAGSLPALFAAAEMSALLSPEKVAEAAASIVSADLEALAGTTLPVCRAIHASLSAGALKGAAGAATFLAAAKARFPISTW